MANVFYAWELGSNLGHLGAFLPLAKALRRNGHEVHWALASTQYASRWLKPAGFRWLQAPRLMDQRPGQAPDNYGDLLLHFGYDQTEILHGLVESWRELFRLTNAQVVLADYAPTAVLAARTMGLPVMLYGNGFCVPPPVHPTPPLRPWRAAPLERLMEHDNTALASINHLLDLYSCSPLSSLAELFQVQERGLLTFAELDHYEGRDPTRYWGPVAVQGGALPDWPNVSGPRVFVHFGSGVNNALTLLQSLQRTEAAFFVYAPDLSTQVQEAISNARIRFSTLALDIQHIAREASAGVLVGGGGVTASTFLREGTPVLLLPNQLEPYLLALRIQAIGAGLAGSADMQPTAVYEMLQRILFESSFIAQAREFSHKYRHKTQQVAIDEMVARVAEIAIER